MCTAFYFHAMSGTELSLRTNRTLTSVNTHNHSSTSSTTESASRRLYPLPWQQCSCADASPGACTDVSSQDGYALLSSAASTNKKRNKELPCLLMCPSRCLPALESSLGIIPTYVPICLPRGNRFGSPMINT